MTGPAQVLGRAGLVMVLSSTLFVASSIPVLESFAAPQERDRILQVATEIMEAARYCALITLGEDGQPQARAMDAFHPDADMTVWLATNPATRKVEQIRRDPRVTLFYLAPDASGYVTMAGTAHLVDEPEAKARWWKEEWEAFYTDRDRGYLLIRVEPEWLEVVSEADGISGDPTTWEPPRVAFGPAGTREEG